ncbi:sensor domain-containing phosphodiesterase [Pseudohaliea rubra]|uniref:EAL domain protein n=1 Tax=Pseudohaliea rubra DSM 19751 TaxID=1265313 RepID=A0A095X0W4_9GAMM|nr:EAL domain-containing protein [Pseudohaliea rubra]KGE04529.1 EAL domain protein [Pseudohaliea rubra DSM 19751]
MNLPLPDDFPRAIPTSVILEDALSTIRRILNMEVAFVGEFIDDQRFFRAVDCAPGFTPIEAGDSGPLQESFCQRVVDGRLPELIPDANANAEARSLEATTALPVGAHISVPIRFPAEGRVFGTFCCFSRRADPTLNKRDLNTMRLFADFLGQFLERREADNLDRKAHRQTLQTVIDTGNFRTVFQPIHDLRAGRIAGFEALTRFPASLGHAPDIVFAEAATVGLAEALEDCTLRAALARLGDLPDDAYLSLNSSPLCVLDGSVEAALADAPLERLVLEVTEHSSIQEYSAIAEALAPLRERGMRVAVDDAGAGYASFRHILKLQPDYIKLDRSLTRRVDADYNLRALAAALITFANETGSCIIAEGVEEESERAALAGLGIDLMQGYLFGRPGPL